MTLTPRVRAARTAPSTSDFGAWSPPIASTAMVSMFGRGYSCSTSTTSRPLYCPQCGHTRCGSLGSWQLGHSDIPGVFNESCARRFCVRRAEWRRFGFGISVPQRVYPGTAGLSKCFQVLQTLESGPPVAGPLILAVARRFIAVLAARRTDPSAIFVADSLHGHDQQDLFA